MERYDCFAYENEHRCNALNDKWCNGCKFYKTIDEYDTNMENSMRICREKGIDTYDAYFRYYKKMKRLREMRGVNDESINDIPE